MILEKRNNVSNNKGIMKKIRKLEKIREGKKKNGIKERVTCLTRERESVSFILSKRWRKGKIGEE